MRTNLYPWALCPAMVEKLKQNIESWTIHLFFGALKKEKKAVFVLFCITSIFFNIQNFLANYLLLVSFQEYLMGDIAGQYNIRCVIENEQKVPSQRPPSLKLKQRKE